MALPSLETNRLSLHPAGPADLDALWTLWRDPAVRRYLFDEVPVTRERAEEILDGALARTDDGLGLWVVRRRGAAAIIGAVGLLPAAAATVSDPALIGAPELLAALEPSAWGRGYAAEVLEVLLEYALVQRGFPRVIAVVDVPNEAPHRIVRRVGLEPIGQRDGARHRLVTYAIDASRFGVRIRPATPSDVAAIEHIARTTWRATYRDIIPEEVQDRALAAWYSPVALTRVVAYPETIFLVAADREDVVGFAQFVPRTSAVAELTRIYLLPERQGQGIGSRLLETGVAQCRERGVTELTVFVERENRSGRAFYRARRFAELAEHRREVEGHLVTLVEGRRSLAPPATTPRA